MIIFLVLFIITYPLKYTIAQNMDIAWQQCYGGSENDFARNIFNYQNGYYLIGKTYSNDGNVTNFHGLSDVWLIKTDSSGNMVWEKTYGGTKGEGGQTILTAPDSSYYLVCTSVSSDGDISNDPYPTSSDFWIVKIDKDGEIIWDKILGGNGIDETQNAILTTDYGMITIGQTTSNDGDISIFYGFWDIWIVKINSNGEKEWDFTIGGTGPELAEAIIQTSDEGYLICGGTINPDGIIQCNNYHGSADVLLVKLDSLRNIEWVNCYGGNYHDEAFGLLELEDGYVFTGYTDSNDGDVSGFHGIPGDPLGSDIWVVKIDFSGNIIWQKCLGGSKGEHARNIFQTEDSGFMVIGQTKSNDGDVVGFHGVAGYNYDIWMVKLSNLGELEWQKCLGGDGEEEIYHGIVKKNDYDYVIAGSSDYPSGDVVCNLHGWDDYWIFEINDSTSGFIETQKRQKEILVYPNPANNYVVFELAPSISPNGGKNIIFINDVFGQVVATLSIQNHKLVWDTREVKPGVYFFRYEMNGVWGTGKIVISK